MPLDSALCLISTTWRTTVCKEACHGKNLDLLKAVSLGGLNELRFSLLTADWCSPL